MKIIRFRSIDGIKYGIMEGNTVKALKGSPFDDGWDGSAPETDGTEYEPEKIELLSPCVPSKYLGVGLNAKSIACAKGGSVPERPLTFMKPSGAVIGPEENIILTYKEKPNYICEGELAVVIGKKARNVKRQDAAGYILGCTCTNDVADADYRGKDELHFKGPDTFGPIGPCIDTDIDPEKAMIRSRKNGITLQEGSTADMMFSASFMVEAFSEYMTLYPGDVIAMGTPCAPFSIQPGDRVEIEVEGIGVLGNSVAERRL